MNTNDRVGNEVQDAGNTIERSLQRPHRTTTARIEIPEREVSQARPLLNDETMAGQHRVLGISRDQGGILTILDSPAPSARKKRESSPAGSGLRLPKAEAGRSLGSANDLEDVHADASDRYCARYTDVLREFRAGELLDTNGRIVTERYEAKAIAADEARRGDAGP